MAEAGANVVSLEIDPFLKVDLLLVPRVHALGVIATDVQTWFEEAVDGLPAKDHVDVRVGPALETMKALDGRFDMVFIDANKSEYRDYVQTLLDRFAHACARVVCGA